MIELLLVGVFGACIGSFSSMLLYRLPEMRTNKSLTLSSPRSYCPHCQSSLNLWMLLPIFSFLIQKGKCLYCSQRINSSYLINELVHISIILLIALNVGINFIGFIYYLIFSIFYILFFLDLKHLFLPIYLNVSLILIGLLINIVFNIFTSYQEALLGLVAGFGSLWFINALFKIIKSKDGIGGGDFILLGGLGSIFGISSLGPIILLGSSFSLLIYTLSNRTKREEIPLGSGLILGAIFFYLIQNIFI
jgi:leader peptidase (prepilin peptidase)/N-methyltransferase